MLAGRPTRGYTAREWVDLTYAVVSEGMDSTARTRLDERLVAALPDREAWGTDPAAQRAQRAMMAMAGPPAKPRTPKEQPA